MLKKSYLRLVVSMIMIVLFITSCATNNLNISPNNGDFKIKSTSCGDTYSLRFYYDDDITSIYLNGNKIAETGKVNQTTFDITHLLSEGTNIIRFGKPTTRVHFVVEQALMLGTIQS